jgi:hypothetical protein
VTRRPILVFASLPASPVDSRLALVLALVAPASAFAINVPLPTTDATLNADVQLQPWFTVSESPE